MNISESFSMPLVALTIGTPAPHVRRRLARDLARRVARDDEDDHLRALERARGIDPCARTLSESSMPGR